jgi:hypothetical protein
VEWIEDAERLRRMNAAVPENRVRAESWIFAILAAEIIALNIFWTPISLDFAHFAFCDNGANLTLQYLIAHGYRPTIEFAYHYGLLPILVARIWFALTGANPMSYQILIVICSLGIGLAFARILAILRLRSMSIAIIFITLWFSVYPNYPSIAHASEALLLALALSEQASGREKWALVFASMAVFAKPSMGYVYLAWLIILWIRRTPRPQWSDRLLPEVMIPVAITGSVCAAVLSAIYGLLALAHTVFPLEGATAYKVLNYGFFSGSGRIFWEPMHASLASYIFGVSGLWIVLTIFLAFSAAGATKRLWFDRDSSDSPDRFRDEVILTCFVLHATFVCLFFGNQWSWFYYSYFLVIGVAVAADVSITGRRIGLAVCCIGVLSLFGTTLAVLRDWKTQQPRAATAWLWSPPAEAAEWNHVLELTRNVRATILDTKGAAELMYPQFQPPVSLFLDRGLMLQSEIQRKILQLGDSDMVVVPINVATCSGIPDSPEIRAAMQSFEPVFGGEFFDVYRLASSGAGR